jgi:hypothetical protein
MDWIYYGSGCVSLADLCENDSEGTGFTNGKEFLDDVTSRSHHQANTERIISTIKCASMGSNFVYSKG